MKKKHAFGSLGIINCQLVTFLVGVVTLYAAGTFVFFLSTPGFEVIAMVLFSMIIAVIGSVVLAIQAVVQFTHGLRRVSVPMSYVVLALVPVMGAGITRELQGEPPFVEADTFYAPIRIVLFFVFIGVMLLVPILTLAKTKN